MKKIKGLLENEKVLDKSTFSRYNGIILEKTEIKKMERTMNDIIREFEESNEVEMVTVCECCGSENVHTAGDGGMGFCEDCDAPCSTIEVAREEERDDPRADLYAIQ